MDTNLEYPDSPMDPEDLDATPCKGCGQILEEGKAFELAGHRWHIDCFRCNTCQTLLDSDANLLLLGDGSLICNNCTYSCSACGNKIEDLAILTGDHAYCAGCFRCRNCKRRIENLRYARTSQGMFCMDCHDALMARRRKKSVKNSSRKQHLDKSLPSLPPNIQSTAPFSPVETPAETPMELPGSIPSTRLNSAAAVDRDASPAGSDRGQRNKSNHQQDGANRNTTRFEMPADDFIPMALDPNVADGPSPLINEISQQQNGKASSSAKAESETPGTDYFSLKEKSTKRKPVKDPRAGDLSRKDESQPNSPVVSLKREDSGDKRKPLATIPTIDSSNREVPSRTQSEQDKFKLQEAPKRRKSSGQQYTGPGPKEGFPLLSLDSSPVDLNPSSKYSSPSPLREQHVNIGKPDSARSSQADTPTQRTPLAAQDTKTNENTLDLPVLPKRGDSLQKSPVVQRKEVPGSRSTSHEGSRDGKSPLPTRSYETSSSMNGGLVIGRPMESPISKSVNNMTVESGDDSANGDSFVSPRAAPPRPAETTFKHKTKGSVGTIRSESRNGDHPASPGLNRPQHSENDEGKTIEEGGPGFFTRTFSKSARHARSHSDRGSRNSKEHKWPKTTLNGPGLGDREPGSPLMSSPEAKPTEVSQANQEIARLRHESYLERQRNQDLEARIAELEGTLDGKASISKVNSELREKRSTIVVLDTQKEIVIRELEVITEHLQAAKTSDKKLDLSSMQQKMLKDFVEELNKLKDSYTPQIEELIQQKSNLQDEVDQLVQKRDRSFKEFEQLSGKNAQLAELNNQLVGTINELQSKVHSHEHKGGVPGLGIYTHHPKERSNLSIDSRDINNSIAESQFTGSTITDHGPDSATILHAPQVVNIQKGQASKRSYWKKGGTMAKGMKGLKGAFTSADPKTGREGSVGGLTEGIPYGQMSSGGEPVPVTVLPGPKGAENERQGFGFFGQQKGRVAPGKPTLRDHFTNVPVAEPSVIFGSELEMRAAYEGVSIPYIVTRCIEEVELRGMHSEGIYRKSGSKTQTDAVKEMFQRGDDSEISDPDFDINAVASALKQYFRNLPTPLLTYALYDRLLEATKLPQQECLVAVRNCIIDLPSRHRDTLEFLIFHLARVVKLQDANLMTSTNCGVVFAPTIMMGEEAQKDLQNTQQKNWLISFLIDNCKDIFLHSGEGLNGLS